MLKVIILPRQAPDKDSENSKKGPFSQVQYCMALPSDLLVSLQMDAVTNYRASDDYAGSSITNFNLQTSSLLVNTRPQHSVQYYRAICKRQPLDHNKTFLFKTMSCAMRNDRAGHWTCVRAKMSSVSQEESPARPPVSTSLHIAQIASSVSLCDV